MKRSNDQASPWELKAIKMRRQKAKYPGSGMQKGMIKWGQLVQMRNQTENDTLENMEATELSKQFHWSGKEQSRFKIYLILLDRWITHLLSSFLPMLFLIPSQPRVKL